VDKQRQRELKAKGKAEVERRSAELRAATLAANPARVTDENWATNYKRGTELERWLRAELPVLHAEEFAEKFVAWDRQTTWTPAHGLYVQCELCGSAVPSLVPRKLFYWQGCACGNIKYRMILWWRWAKVQQPQAMSAVKLIGKGLVGNAQRDA
jgi:hypothetical protein